MIDVHGHYLPAVDDGCRDVADSLACARLLVAAGYSHAFCTPHIWPSLPKNNRDSIVSGVEQLQCAVDDAGTPPRSMPGAEYSLPAIAARVRDTPADQIVSYGMNGKYVL